MDEQTLPVAESLAAVERSCAVTVGAGPVTETSNPRRVDRLTSLGQRVLFWVRRYLPAEIVATASVLVVGMAALEWSKSAAVTAIAATVAENLAFYGVFLVAVYREQRRRRPTRREALSRSLFLLAAEFGPAEVIDSLVIRPWAFGIALWLIPDAGWALVVGKVVADVVFYFAAAGGFSLTMWAGLRGSDERR